MKLWIYIQKTALHIAAEKENIETVKLLLSQPKIDINILSIFILKFSIQFKAIFFIQFNHEFERKNFNDIWKKKFFNAI